VSIEVRLPHNALATVIQKSDTGSHVNEFRTGLLSFALQMKEKRVSGEQQNGITNGWVAFAFAGALFQNVMI
jgi:hypothetical protein